MWHEEEQQRSPVLLRQKQTTAPPIALMCEWTEIPVLLKQEQCVPVVRFSYIKTSYIPYDKIQIDFDKQKKIQG